MSQQREPRRGKPQQIADEIRALILGGEFADGELLGREPELIDRYGVSRPSLREALRILEAEGLVSVLRGTAGGVVAREPGQRHVTRTAAMVLQSRNVPLADVYRARTILEPAVVREVAASPARNIAAAEIRRLIDAQRRVLEDPAAYGRANAEFHAGLIAQAGNTTLAIVAQMLEEIVARAVAAVSAAGEPNLSLAVRKRGLRSQERLAELVQTGDAVGAAEHWREHMSVVGRVMLGHRASTVVDLLDYDESR